MDDHACKFVVVELHYNSLLQFTTTTPSFAYAKENAERNALLPFLFCSVSGKYVGFVNTYAMDYHHHLL